MPEDDLDTARRAPEPIRQLKNSSLWETLDASWLRDAGETPDELWEKIRSHFETRRAEAQELERGASVVMGLLVRPGSR